MKKLDFILISVFVVLGFVEPGLPGRGSDRVVLAEIGVGYDGGYFAPYPTPEQIPVFDDSVFQLKRKHRPVYSHEGRFLDDPPDFSEARRTAWIHLCKQKEGKSFRRFKSCFEEARENYEHQRAEKERQEIASDRDQSDFHLDPY